MLRVRKPNGEVEEIPEGRFVEIIDEVGNIAHTLFATKKGEVIRIDYKSGQARRDYERLYGVKFISTIIDKPA